MPLQEITDRYDTAGHEPREIADPQPAPEDLAASRQVMFDTVRRLIHEELTERQREAIVAVMLGGMPLEEAARRMGTNRNALYKLLHDARKKLKRCLISGRNIRAGRVGGVRWKVRGATIVCTVIGRRENRQ